MHRPLEQRFTETHCACNNGVPNEHDHLSMFHRQKCLIRKQIVPKSILETGFTDIHLDFHDRFDVATTYGI